MRTRDAMRRLKELATALANDAAGTTYTDLPASIRRTIRLIESCPWIVDGDVVGEVVAAVEKKVKTKEPAK